MAAGTSDAAAFRCQVRDNQLAATATTTVSDCCPRLEVAMYHLARGEVVNVQAGDITALRRALARVGVGVGA